MGCQMRLLNILKLGLFSIFLSTILIANVVTAESIKPAIDSIGISIAVVVAAIATIIAFFTLGGIKYVNADNVLDTEVRKSLYNYIDEYPGSHLREIARELDLKPSNAAWHLRKLEQTNLVRSRSIGGKRVYYLVEGGVETRREAVAEAVLKNDNAQKIMKYLQKHPRKHLLEIANALKLNHHTVKWHIKKLYIAELIEGDTSNSAYPVYYATDIGIRAIENYSKSSNKQKIEVINN